MKNIELKKSDDSWMVRQTNNINGSTVWRTSYYDKITRAILCYIRLLFTKNNSK
jgi:hypothetical protein